MVSCLAGAQLGCLSGLLRHSAQSAGKHAGRVSAAQTGRSLQTPRDACHATLPATQAVLAAQKGVSREGVLIPFRIFADGALTMVLEPVMLVVLTVAILQIELAPHALLSAMLVCALSVSFVQLQPPLLQKGADPLTETPVDMALGQAPRWPNVLNVDVEWSDAVRQCSSKQVLNSAMSGSTIGFQHFDSDADKLLGQLDEIVSTCRTCTGRVADMVITHCIQQPSRRVSLASKRNCPVGIVCAEVLLNTDLPLDAILWALYDIDERLSWDGATFSSYEVLRPSVQQGSSNALGDVIYCRMPTIAGMSDRDMVQERFLMRLTKCAAWPVGGFAIVMRSPSEDTARKLGRPPMHDVVRATSIISGFILQPEASGTGVLFTAVSCTEDSSVPRWAQVLAQKSCAKKSLDMVERLQNHCNSRRPDN